MERNSVAPCLEMGCSWCCDPVKIPMYNYCRIGSIPDIFKIRSEVWASVSAPDSKIKIFDCLLFDSKTGKCRDYENRPKTCRNSTCLADGSTESIRDQVEKTRQAEFLKIIPIRRCQPK
ncbi:MAG: hypothetical protein UV36_C0004G0007 [Parcubacteria group bacterium GW2011_GWC2_42_6]|nr:MAG: hypothetical protein UV36_C0004G0007 [Parcubacteria group bacterium GW2011_GWC2_42_6]KKT76439.1 MAG: hypothetical protein UW72_C0005G0007 [Parcubacteria group bacterium GW2011_GWF2_44_7]